MTLKQTLTKAAKNRIAKQVGRQVKKILERNISFIEPNAADFAEKYAIYLASRAISGMLANKKPPASKKPASNAHHEPAPEKSDRVKIRITGMNKVVKDAMWGKSVERALKDRAGIYASFTFKF